MCYSDGSGIPANANAKAGPVAQSVERWTPYGGSIRPGFQKSGVRGATGARCLSSILAGMVAAGGRP